MGTKLRIEIRYLSAVRDRTGRGRDEVSFPVGATLREVAAWLKERHALSLPNRQWMATLNGSGWEQLPGGLSTELQEGDVICLFPPVAGG